MKKNNSYQGLIITLLIFLTCLNMNARGKRVEIGTLHTMESKILQEDFTYFTHLPDNYEKSSKKYPVLYLMNAHMTSTFANGVATVDVLGFEQIPEIILIGISNTGRARNYFPVRPGGKSGQAEVFLKFLSEELIPHIDKNYRTENFKILYGQSNTGLFTIYALLAKPNVFNAYLAASPGLGWCLDFMKNKTMKLFSAKKSLKNFLFITYGGRDYQDLVIKPTLEYCQLLEKITPPDFEFKLEKLINDGHVPIASLNNGLLALFPNFMATDELQSQGLPAIEQHYLELSQKYGFRIETPEEVLFNMSYQLKGQKKYLKAIKIMKILLDKYPFSLRGHFYLGEIYREKGELESAKKSYKRALEIQNDFEPAKIRLANMEKKKTNE